MYPQVKFLQASSHKFRAASFFPSDNLGCSVFPNKHSFHSQFSANFRYYYPSLWPEEPWSPTVVARSPIARITNIWDFTSCPGVRILLPFSNPWMKLSGRVTRSTDFLKLHSSVQDIFSSVLKCGQRGSAEILPTRIRNCNDSSSGFYFDWKIARQVFVLEILDPAWIYHGCSLAKLAEKHHPESPRHVSRYIHMQQVGLNNIISVCYQSSSLLYLRWRWIRFAHSEEQRSATHWE
jgi:hypothetical protein